MIPDFLRIPIRSRPEAIDVADLWSARLRLTLAVDWLLDCWHKIRLGDEEPPVESQLIHVAR